MIELQSIVEGCQRGDTRCQQWLYETYSPRYFALCLRYAPSREEAEDLLVIGFTKIFRSIGDYSGSGSFEGWMRRIFVNEAINCSRQPYAQHYVAVDELPETGEQSDASLSMDVAEALRKSLQLLSPNERAIFNLVAVEGYSMAEAAAKLKVPLSTGKSQYFRARETMKRALIQQLGYNYFK